MDNNRFWQNVWAGQNDHEERLSVWQIIGLFAVAIVLIDVFGFMAWVVSGQTPVDGFYIGALTAKVLGLVL